MANLRTKNITYDDRDTNNLIYGPSWFHYVTWNASNVGQSGTLTVANDLNASVTFSELLYEPFLALSSDVLPGFPVPAIAFYYFGMLRSKGGFYDDGKNPPVVLFSKRFDTPAQHVVILRNQNDIREPGGNSQITIDRFVLEVVDNLPTPAIPSPSPSLTSDTVKLGPPIGAIVGSTIGGLLLAIIMIVTGVYYWRRRRGQLVSVRDNLDSGVSSPAIVPYPVMDPSISKQERPKAGQSTPTLQRPPSPTPSSGSTAIVTYFRFRRRGWQREADNDVERRPERRREADAGPIPAEDEESTLPPLYEQVFQAGPSNRPPPDQEPNGQSQPSASIMQDTAKQPI
ncbi:hypothetical protein AAF712_011657 [Marasmius tenuissimus]|uniref:Peptidase A1 domain-containing protein n=1 Tax=Marasmius tenuissimus TaxID=585030 RepID=A0ABR2ZKK9_9AGAR